MVAGAGLRLIGIGERWRSVSISGSALAPVSASLRDLPVDGSVDVSPDRRAFGQYLSWLELGSGMGRRAANASGQWCVEGQTSGVGVPIVSLCLVTVGSDDTQRAQSI